MSVCTNYIKVLYLVFTDNLYVLEINNMAS